MHKYIKCSIRITHRALSNLRDCCPNCILTIILKSISFMLTDDAVVPPPVSNESALCVVPIFLSRLNTVPWGRLVVMKMALWLGAMAIRRDCCFPFFIDASVLYYCRCKWQTIQVRVATNRAEFCKYEQKVNALTLETLITSIPLEVTSEPPPILKFGGNT